LTLGIFALGTVPVLLGIGVLFGSVKGRVLAWAKAGVSGVMIALSLQTGMNGLALLNFLPAVTPSTQTIVATQQQEEQIISMQVTPYGTYAPDTFVVKKNIPVIWSIERADDVGCADSLVLSAFHIFTPLKKGDNTIRFVPDRTGRFTFSCAMGMIRGTLIVE
jgi:plastocyanin domain-containing protein